MKIVHIQTGLPPSGNVPYKLHELMLNNGTESCLIVFDSRIPLDDRISEMPSLRKRIYARVYNFYHKKLRLKIKINAYAYSNPVTFGFNIANHPKIKNSDIIYLHWAIGGFLSLKSIQKLVKTTKPIVIYLHDMWPITGGCHHSFDCRKYETGCNKCPLFIQEKETYAQNQLLFKRKLAEENANVYFVAPSKWMAESASKSLATSKRKIFQIPHFIDSTIYKLIDKDYAREIFNLPLNKKIIGFGAVNGLKNAFKGAEYLEESLMFLSKQCKYSELTIVTFGTNDNNKKLASHFETINVGRINDHKTMALIYNAMDVFVTPSLAESFGMTALESIACGTPVVCFDVGGLQDVVNHRFNGYKAVLKDTKDLAYGINFCLKNKLTFTLDNKYKLSNNIDQHFQMINQIIRDQQKNTNRLTH